MTVRTISVQGLKGYAMKARSQLLRGVVSCPETEPILCRRSWRLQAFLTAAVALSFAGPASAQFTNQSGIGGGYYNLICPQSSGLSSCGFTGFARIIALNAAASAYGDNFGLHARATISETLLQDVGPGAVILETAGAGSTLNDTFTFVGPHPQFAEVSFTVTTHGFSSGESSAFTQLDIGDGVDLLAVPECIVHDSGTCTAHGRVNLNLNFWLILHLAASASADLRSGAGSLAAGSTASGQALYYDTASITNLSFSDTFGRPLDIHYVSQAGLTYPMPAAPPVPEPETFVLLLVGLGALALASRRRFLR